MANPQMEITAHDEAIYDKLRPFLVDMLQAGHSVNQIANMASKDEKKTALKVKRKLEAMIQRDARTQMAIMDRTQQILVAALPKAAEALAERVEAGRPDAVKLLFELSGAYTRTEKHEHSGGIEIKLTNDVPRPKRIEAEVIEGEATEEQ